MNYPFDPAFTLNYIFQQLTESQPSEIALLAPDRPNLTYQALFDQISRLRNRLNDLGVSRRDRVALILPNGAEMALTFLAVACTAACAPLNPAYRESEFEFYLSDLKPKLLILPANFNSPARQVALAQGIPILEIIPEQDAPAGVSWLQQEPPVDISDRDLDRTNPDDVALILHTSGTTSQPKMVPLTHRNLYTSAQNIVQTLRLSSRDRSLNVMPLFHIHGLVGVLLASLMSGGSVVCTPGFYGSRFFDWLETFQPSWYSAVPTLHQSILAIAGRQNISDTFSLRLIRSSSASLPPPVMEKLESLFQVPVIESYGMTEAAHQMTSNPLPPQARKPGSVGIVVSPQVGIMNEAGDFLETEQIGEVVIQGNSVMQGYANPMEANATAFTKGWFRTGDLGYFDVEGYLFLKGRIKEIINRAGEKISPRELDDVLLCHPDIEQAVAFAMPDPNLGEEVAVAIVLHPQRSLTTRAVQEFVATRLADFKVPRRVVFVDEIPKGVTGKLQRIGLAKQLGLSPSSDV